MTGEQLREKLHAQPFQAFRIRMADGRTFHVAHPDFVAVAPNGRTAVVYRNESVASTLDLLLMTELETVPSAEAP